MDWLLGILAAVFIFGTSFFWLFGVAIFCLLVGLTENERDGWAAISFIVFVTGVSYFNSIQFNLSVWDIVLYFVYYLALGCGWSFLKWVSFLYKSRDTLTKLKTNFLNTFVNTSRNDEQITKISDDRFHEFAKYLSEQGYASDGSSMYGPTIQSRDDLIPNVANYKGKISRWIAYWPFSAFWTILNDPIRRIAEWLYSVLQGFYRNIANRVFKDFQV